MFEIAGGIILAVYALTVLPNIIEGIIEIISSAWPVAAILGILWLILPPVFNLIGSIWALTGLSEDVGFIGLFLVLFIAWWVAVIYGAVKKVKHRLAK